MPKEWLKTPSLAVTAGKSAKTHPVVSLVTTISASLATKTSL
jgi:hypothetical protein